jgi:hypothetical protein
VLVALNSSAIQAATSFLKSTTCGGSGANVEIHRLTPFLSRLESRV